MSDFNAGDIVVGSNAGYVAHYRYVAGTPTLIQHLTITDALGNPLSPNGLCFGPDRDLYVAAGDPAGAVSADPHDVAYVRSTPPMLAVILANTDDTADIRLYDLDGVLQTTYAGVDVSADWTQASGRMLKLDVDCAGETAYYTDRGETIFTFDLVGGMQGTPFATRSDGLIFADFQLLGNARPDLAATLVVNETASGNGPRNAVAIAVDGYYSDEINPGDGNYDVFKRNLADGTDLLSFLPDLDPAGGTQTQELTALAVAYDVCSTRRQHTWVHIIPQLAGWLAGLGAALRACGVGATVGAGGWRLSTISFGAAPAAAKVHAGNAGYAEPPPIVRAELWRGQTVTPLVPCGLGSF